MRLRLVSCVFLLLLVLSLSGCSGAGTGADGMMKPPRAAGDGGAIQDAITAKLGDQISLRFPRNGENRSAVVRADIDGDGTEEAVAFYRLATESSGAHMLVLDTDERGDWQVSGDQDGGGGDIDRVMFGDINGDGSTEIITGWSPYAGTDRIMTAYSYDGEKLRELPIFQLSADGERSAAVYTEMVTCDVDGDGLDDIISVYLDKQNAQANASLFKFQHSALSGNCMVSSISTGLDGSVAEYLGAQAGSITESITGLFLDGYRSDGTCCTELVYWNPSTAQLVTPLNSPDDKHAMFTRSCRAVSTDINGDGIIELPGDELLPCYSADDADALYLTTWHCYLSGSSTHEIGAMLMREQQGYNIIFKDSWRGRVTARADSTSGGREIMYFCQVAKDGGFGVEIMRIKPFTAAEWESESAWEPMDIIGDSDSPRFRELESNDYYTYAVLISGSFTDIEKYPQFSFEKIHWAFQIVE